MRIEYNGRARSEIENQVSFGVKGIVGSNRCGLLLALLATSPFLDDPEQAP